MRPTAAFSGAVIPKKFFIFIKRTIESLAPSVPAAQKCAVTAAGRAAAVVTI